MLIVAGLKEIACQETEGECQAECEQDLAGEDPRTAPYVHQVSFGIFEQ